MQLKTLQIPTGAVFAPMAGLTDAACRHLMADHGAAWTVSEMASAKALCFGDRKSFALLKDPAPHGLYAIQLFGAEPETLAKAILLVREKGIRFDMLDINMGCPAPKITSSGAGSRLLLDPPLCGAMVAAARKALGDDTPLTVKMRIGWDDEHRTGVEVARQCAGNGADLLAVHGRTREQMYIPPIDAAAIAAIKQAVDIPVLANGDVTSAEGRAGAAARDRLRRRYDRPRPRWATPGCLSVCARRCWARSRLPPPRCASAWTRCARKFTKCVRKKASTWPLPQARSQAMHYMKGLRGAASLRRYCSMLEHFTDVDTLIDAVYRLQE